jgi:hypothetical protein
MRLYLPALLALAVAGCASTPTVDVTRFHLGQPIPFDTISVVSASQTSLEDQARLKAVEAELARLGFRPTPDNGKSAYIATLRAEQTSRAGAPRGSPVNIGIGGGTRTGNVGIGGSVNVPVGGQRSGPRVFSNLVMLDIRRRSDEAIVWEGRALQEAPENSSMASLTQAMPALARALLKDFPGPSGQMVRVPLK